MEDFGFEIRNYQRLESGRHSPSLYTLHKLARAFDVDLEEFFKD
jgi:transcriptional regulator with XRE-family HTH domain